VRHPPLSRRGAALASTPRASVKLGGPARPFRVGSPALDRVPVHAWTRLAMRRLKAMSITQLDYADPPGLLALRQQIAEHVRRVRGASCSAEARSPRGQHGEHSIPGAARPGRYGMP
jgi:DNA-binding transcriptional MocR family regulator